MVDQNKGLSRNISNVKKDEGWNVEKGTKRVS